MSAMDVICTFQALFRALNQNSTLRTSPTCINQTSCLRIPKVSFGFCRHIRELCVCREHFCAPAVGVAIRSLFDLAFCQFRTRHATRNLSIVVVQIANSIGAKYIAQSTVCVCVCM